MNIIYHNVGTINGVAHLCWNGPDRSKFIFLTPASRSFYPHNFTAVLYNSTGAGRLNLS